jgi:ribosomal protein S14
MKGKCFADRLHKIAFARHELTRMALTLVRKDKEMPVGARMLAQRYLARLPVASSVTRLGRRCLLNARGTGVVPEFGLGRHAFREEALAGRLMGVTKSCW